MARSAGHYKLFRRHRKGCAKGYEKEDRVFEYDNKKATGREQCDCSIAVEGKIGKLFVKAKSTDTSDWNQARLIVNHWEKTGKIGTLPDRLAPEEPITVLASIVSYEMVQRNKPVSDDRIKQYAQLLRLRLIPFAESRRIQFIQEMDNPKIWAQFRDSWKDENPFRNQKVNGPRPVRKVGRQTASRMIADLRTFLKYCVKNQWLSENYATRDYGMLTTKIKDPKEPFADEDLLYIYRAAEHVTDGKGSRHEANAHAEWV
jgi:hypothetical protein